MLANIFAGAWFPPVLQSPINCGAFCMLAGLIIMPVVSLFTPAPGPSRVKEIFSCYERTVTVAVTDSIGPRDDLAEEGPVKKI